jgi:membrane associated rhomboid family serine protease
MSARRWPAITLGLIFVNIAAFLGTHWVIERQQADLLQVQEHVLVLAAKHPELTLFPKAQAWVDDFSSRYPEVWAEMQKGSYEALDEWESRIRLISDPAELQREMTSLGDQYFKLIASSIMEQYGSVSANPRLMTYITSTFLHAGWWHLIGNLWFLWLAGFVLEDAWGRPLYLLVYLAAGAAACQFDIWAGPGSTIPSIGASGAIAGLLGALLVRFPKLRIRMMWFFDLGLFPMYRFWVRAHWVLPAWALLEINYGNGSNDGIGHWAHVGGFLFGSIAALALRYSGLEQKVNDAIENKVAWRPPAEITQANELMEQGKLDEATSLLKEYLTTTPDSTPAWNLLRAVYWRGSNVAACRAATITLCQLHLAAPDRDTAWKEYEEFLSLGGETMPPDAWLDLCKSPEEQMDFERALTEYRKLAAAYPSDRRALIASLRAARILLKQLDRPKDALSLFNIVSASPLPHLDLEQEIKIGILQAETALLDRDAPSTKAASATS